MGRNPPVFRPFSQGVFVDCYRRAPHRDAKNAGLIARGCVPPLGMLLYGDIRVGIVALFFLFTREILRFVQFLVLAVAIAVIFYTPSIVQTLAQGIANALGVH